MKDYYKILRIPRFSDNDTVKASYKDLVKIYHPDKNNGKDFFHEYMKLINEAYSVLSENVSKSKYDEILKNHPDLIELNEVLVLPRKVHFSFKKLISKKGNISIVIFSIILVLLIGAVIYLINLNNKVVKELRTERLERIRINEEIVKNKQKQDESKKELKRKIQIQLSKLKKESKNTRDFESNSIKNSQSSNTNQKPKKTNPCKNVTLITGVSEVYITNNNSNALQSVDVIVNTKKTYYWTKVPHTEFDSYEESYSHVKPGLNLFSVYGTIRSVKIIRCLDWNGNYSLP